MMEKTVHFIGIGGSGLSAIARVLVEGGASVQGSDRLASPFTRELESLGVRVAIGHRAENIAGANLVIRSSAVTDENVEVQAARAAGLPVLKRADFLGQLMEGRFGVAVAGSHGKTTTTAMVAWVLAALGQDPSYIIGAVAQNLGANAHAGKGQAFVIEADEYDHMFLGLRPRIAVVTNIEHDHPDCFPTEAGYRQAFRDFASRLAPDGLLLACSDDPGAAWLLQAVSAAGQRALGYGLQEQPDKAPTGQNSSGQDAYQASRLAANPAGGFTFEAVGRPPEGGEAFSTQVSLQAPGVHNVRNALAALAVADQMGLSISGAAEALGSFRGTGRRFEVLGEPAGVTLVDDYAHHPTEIRATLAAARARYAGRQIWAVWQPHTYSRTEMLFAEFASAFRDADRVLVTEVYAAREPRSTHFSARQVVKAMNHPGAIFVPDLEAAFHYLLEHLRQGDVLLVLSAGDADQISARLMPALQERNHTDV